MCGFDLREACRCAYLTKECAGDFEIIMELPRGQHEIKFVINGETWRCHPDLETKRDSQVAC